MVISIDYIMRGYAIGPYTACHIPNVGAQGLRPKCIRNNILPYDVGIAILAAFDHN